MAVSGCASTPSDAPMPTDDDPCPWTTSSGRKSCGARPPAHRVSPQPIARWLMQFDEPMQTATDGTGAERELVWTNLAPIDFRDLMPQLALRTTNIARAARFELVLGTHGFVNAYTFTLRSNQGQQWMPDGGWSSFSVSWSPNAVTGSPDRGRITDVKLRLVDDAQGFPITLAVGGIALVEEPVMRYPRGVLSFTFDDNHDTMITEAAPRLDAKGFAATAYIIIDQLDLAARATKAQLHERQDRGWDIAAHSYSSYAHNERWTTLPPSVLEDDIVDARAWLMAEGFTGYDHCAYPGGDFTNGGTTDVLAIVDKYFTSCRTIYQRQREAYPPADSRKLRVFYVTSGTTLASAKAAVDSAITAREWIIVVFHRLVDVPTLSTEWSKQDFAAFVDYVAASGIPVEPVATVLAE